MSEFDLEWSMLLVWADEAIALSIAKCIDVPSETDGLVAGSQRKRLLGSRICGVFVCNNYCCYFMCVSTLFFFK